MNPKNAHQIRKSRDFKGNQHTSEQSTSLTSASAEKLLHSTSFDVKYDQGFNYVILVFSLVFPALPEILKCKTFDGDNLQNY